MQIVLYRFTGEDILLDKTNHLEELDIIDGAFRDEVSIIDTVINIAGVELDLVVDSENDYVVDTNKQRQMVILRTRKVLECNYIYIPNLNRYYYVKSKDIVRTNLVRFNCHCDVLMSFKDIVLQQSGIVGRQENKYNPMIYDKNRIKTTAYDISKIIVERNLRNYYGSSLDFRPLQDNMYYVVTVVSYIGDDNSYYQNVKIQHNEFNITYIFTSAGFKRFCEGLRNITRQDETGIFTEPSEYIRNIYVLPYYVGFIRENFYNGRTLDEDTLVKLGNYVIDMAPFDPVVPLYAILNPIDDSVHTYTSEPIEITTVDFTDSEKACLAFLPAYGIAEIDISRYTDYPRTANMYISYQLNISTGHCSIIFSTEAPIHRDYGMSFEEGCITQVIEFNLGYELSVGVSNAARLKAAELANEYNTVNSMVKSIGGALTGTLFAGGDSAKDNTLLGLGSGALTGLISAGISGYANNVTRVGQFSISQVAKNSLAGLFTDGTICLFFIKPIYIEQQYDDLVGLPYLQWDILSDCHGFTSMAEIHLQYFTGLQDEKSELERLLRSGVILP